MEAATIDEVARVSEEEGIDAQFRKGGMLSLDRGAHQYPMIRAAFDSYQALGLEDHARLLNSEEATARVKVTNVHGALYTPHNTSVHPGRLARIGARSGAARRGHL